jgi:polyphenol oxidase
LADKILGMQKLRINGISLFCFENMQCDEIKHFITTKHIKQGIDFNLSYSASVDKVKVDENRYELAGLFGLNEDRLLFPKQIHHDKVLCITEGFDWNNKKELLYGIDALVTNLPQVCILVKSADCVPILYFDKKNKVVACAHAGWRGTLANIAGKTFQTMQQCYNSKAEDVFVGIGPSIGPMDYEVGQEVITETQRLFPHLVKNVLIQREGQYFFDLWACNSLLLQEAGVLTKNIEVAGISTYSNPDLFYSYRQSGGKCGRFAAGIMIN